MGAFVVRRLLAGLLIVWGVYTLTFFAVNLAPGDPFANLENPKTTKEDLDRLRARWGYDKPVLVRYLVHLKRMFWAEREVLEVEGGGLLFRVEAAEGVGNVLSADVQVSPAEVVLEPLEESRREGRETVRLERRPDGTYASKPLLPGKYKVGRGRIAVGASGGTELSTSGVLVKVADGVASAVPALLEAPPSVRLERDGGEPLLLPRQPDGSYGPLATPPDRWRYAGADVVVPTERLEPGGLGFSLGESVKHKKPVVEHLARPLLNTLLLGLAAVLVEFVLGVAMGVISAVRQGSRLDHGVTLGALFVYSMPGFWLALMLMLVFAVKLKWLPAEGMHDVGEDGLLDLLQHMVMPVFVLSIGAAAATARYQRSALIEVMRQDFVRTARAKGVPERSVILRHALRNSLLPVITLLGLSLPFLVSGALITETIFSWPGMGRETIDAIHSRDVFVLTGITLIATTMVVVGSILADILYAVADPRVRVG